MNEMKIARYKRIQEQLSNLFLKCRDRDARMATISALLYHKMDGFFWVGFYMIINERLIVRSYQGPLACMELPTNKGVCWTSINLKKSLIVPDIHAFSGHIACNSRSKSEIVIPVWDVNRTILGVLDIDSERIGNFDQVDQEQLEKIISLL
jgi:L-methionine (R)-S-oxide reductase